MSYYYCNCGNEASLTDLHDYGMCRDCYEDEKSRQCAECYEVMEYELEDGMCKVCYQSYWKGEKLDESA